MSPIGTCPGEAPAHGNGRPADTDDPAAVTAIERAVAHLEPVTLDELSVRAALQTRVDRKYVLPLAAAGDLISTLATSARALEIDGTRTFGYSSVYFDTLDLDCYRLAARRRPTRFKIRTRTYLDSQQCWLEVKTQDRRGRTVKHRQAHDVGDQAHLTPVAHAFIQMVLASVTPGLMPLDLRPTLVTEYRRSTLYLPGDDSRLTIDTGLICRQDGAGSVHLPGRAVVESKTALHASAVDRRLWSTGHRPARVSKYSTGLAALRPELPSARWGPVLRRHPFLPEGPSDSQHPHREHTGSP